MKQREGLLDPAIRFNSIYIIRVACRLSGDGDLDSRVAMEVHCGRKV